MTLSAPIHVLRSQAKKLKLEQKITLIEAQNRIAQREGFIAWSHLVAKQEGFLPDSIPELKDYLNQGDLILLGARPRLGKMRVAASLIAATAANGGPLSYFFTLVEREVTVRSKIVPLLNTTSSSRQTVEIDCSDHICAATIIQKLANKHIEGALVVIDYLQVLDEKRINPPVQEQILALKTFAKQTGCMILFIAQLNRNVDERPEQPPEEQDVRLPNPLDLGLFNKTMFLYRSDNAGDATDPSVQLRIRRPGNHEFTVHHRELGIT